MHTDLLAWAACTFLFALATRWVVLRAVRDSALEFKAAKATEEAAKEAEAARLAAQAWAEWRAFHPGCTFCRLTDKARRTGDDEQERVDLGFAAGFILGYGARDHRIHGTRPRNWGLCLRHHKDAVSLAKQLNESFHTASEPASEPGSLGNEEGEEEDE